jgi:hypothetical protein
VKRAAPLAAVPSPDRARDNTSGHPLAPKGESETRSSLVRRGAGAVTSLLLLAGCVETTGGQLVSFSMVASGDPNVVSGGPLEFSAPSLDGSTFDVTLSRARLHVGAVYLSQVNPQNYTLETGCVQSGVYTGEVRGGLDVDLLDPSPQPFPVEGTGTDRPTAAAELWLTGGDILADVDRTVILAVTGTATRGAEAYPFEASFTISSNRVTPPRNPALPGSNPLCEKRIIAPIAVSTTLVQGATVALLVDPRAYFASVDFSKLEKVADSPPLYRFTDDVASDRQPDKALFNAMRASVGPYRLELTPP